MGRRRTTGARAGYGAEIDGLLRDYCAAMDDLPERNAIRAAIRHYIDHQLDQNKGIKAKFEDMRRQRLSSERPGLHVVDKKD